MRKNIISKISILILFPILISGIIRHDIDKEEYLELAKNSKFDNIGKIWINTYFSGSAVLISENYILSAAHNVIESDTRIDTIDNNGQIFYANVPINHRVVKSDSLFIELKGNRHEVENILVHPKFLSDIDRAEYDLVLIKLKEPIKNINPAILDFSGKEMNSNVIGVGYGASGIADKRDISMNMEKIAGQNVVDSIGGIKEKDLPIYMFCDFDSPDNPTTNKLGNSEPRKLEYLCAAGDSGGGLFKENSDEKVTLIGINKGSQFDHLQFQKTVHYGQIMRWTRIAPFKDWINKNCM